MSDFKVAWTLWILIVCNLNERSVFGRREAILFCVLGVVGRTNFCFVFLRVDLFLRVDFLTADIFLRDDFFIERWLIYESWLISESWFFWELIYFWELIFPRVDFSESDFFREMFEAWGSDFRTFIRCWIPFLSKLMTSTKGRLGSFWFSLSMIFLFLFWVSLTYHHGILRY